MKKNLFLAAFLVNISFAFADRPSIFVDISSADKVLHIQSHLRWNVAKDSALSMPYISGNDTLITRKYTLGEKRITIDLFFPKQENGRRLNASTTVHINAFVDGKEVLRTQHFGQHSEGYVPRESSILCRPDKIIISLNSKKEVQVNVQGVFVPSKRMHTVSALPYSEERFSLNYQLPSEEVNDRQITQAVLENGPIPSPINFVEETIRMDALNRTATYTFQLNLNPNSTEEIYHNGYNSLLFCTEKTNESKMSEHSNIMIDILKTYKNQSTIRFFKRNIQFSNTIEFTPKQLVKTGNYTFKLTNSTPNYAIINGMKVLNPIHQTSIKISLLPHWTVESVEVGEDNQYKKEKGSLYLFGDGLSPITYSIHIRENK